MDETVLVLQLYRVRNITGQENWLPTLIAESCIWLFKLFNIIRFRTAIFKKWRYFFQIADSVEHHFRVCKI